MTQLDDSAKARVSGIHLVNEWLAGCSPAQVALLQQHVDDDVIPDEVVVLLAECPLSPMHINDVEGGEALRMPLLVKVALGAKHNGEPTSM
jgi:hypothetical protein